MLLGRVLVSGARGGGTSGSRRVACTGVLMAVGMLLFGCAESRTPTEAAARNGTRMERQATVGAPRAVRYQGRGVEVEIVPPIVESVGRRVALVIGNAAYEESGAGLTNPVRDATAVAEVLRELDFEMFVATDATLERMEQATHDFIQELRSGDAAVFYYSGHGLEQDGENYLVPVDFSAAYYDDEVLLRRRTLVANEVQERMEAAGAQVRMLILDACRSNRFDRNGKSLGRGGLAAMAPRGGLVAFAAEAGRVALDNRDEMNGLFTKHLVAVLREPGLTARNLFARVHDRVRTESHGRQAPATYDAGAGGFVFRPPADLFDDVGSFEARLGRPLSTVASDEGGWTDLHYAAALSRSDVADRLLSQHASVDANLRHSDQGLVALLMKVLGSIGEETPTLEYDTVMDTGGQTALHIAALVGAGDVVAKLIEHEADLEAEAGFYRFRPLDYAAIGGQSAVVRLLVQHGGSVYRTYGDSLVHRAAREGHVDVIRALVGDYGLDADGRTESGETPLYRAAREGHVDVIRALVGDYGADVNGRTESGETPLYRAAREGHVDVIRALVGDYGADVNGRTESGETPLYRAAREGHVDVIRALVGDYGADVNGRTESGETPLHRAVREGHVDVIRALVGDYGADVNARTEDGFRDGNGEGETALNYAAARGDVAAIETLIDYGADVTARDERGRSHLHYAASGGQVAAIRTLMDDYGLDGSARTKHAETALHYAARGGHAAAVRVLVNDYGLDVHVGTEGRFEGNKGHTALHYAAARGHVAVVRVLVEYGVDVNGRTDMGTTALHYAADGDDVAVIGVLVEYGADVNGRDDRGMTSLHHAAARGHVAVIGMLVEYGADVNGRNDMGMTALHYAADGDDVAVIGVLVEYGADVNGRDDRGMTSLHYAASGNRAVGRNRGAAMIRALVGYGLDVNARSDDGETPLHRAARGGYENSDAIKILVDLGANVRARDNGGETPADEAAYAAQDECAAVTGWRCDEVDPSIWTVR